jgi:predicted AlkP superfamily phosphohydrolase/phosphomutase
VTVVVVALDAADEEIVTALAAEGRMPTVARLLREGATALVDNPDSLFVGAVWPTFSTGLSPVRHEFFNWERIDPGTYDRRETRPTEMVGEWFWERLSDEGRRVAVVDVPHTWPRRPVDGVVISEYGCHDRHFGLQSHPPELAADLVARYGPHPVSGLDTFVDRQFCPDDVVHRVGDLRTGDEDGRVLADHLAGVDAKARLSADLLAQGGWDLFVTVFGESHNVGHQLWHVHDDTHPRHDPAVRARIGDPLTAVYEALDRAIAHVLDAAPPDASTVLLLSHGMQAHHDGTHLVDALLFRLHRARQVGPEGSLPARAAKAVLPHLPEAARRRAGAAAAAALRRRLGGSRPAPERAHWGTDTYAWPWFLSPNNTVTGGIRLNLVGREPRGVVQPGDVDRVVERLTEDLLALVNVDTGEPVVLGVRRFEDAYPDRTGDDAFPDLLVDWNRSAAIETIWSPTIGVLHEPYVLWRSGDHRNPGRVVVSAPGVTPDVLGGRVDSRALAPTIAALCGVALDGVDLPSLVPVADRSPASA